MIALSIRQPWAWLIVRPDITDPEERTRAYRDHRIKDVENRTWWTPYRGQFLVHAGKTMTRAEYADCAAMAFDVARIELPPADQLERGGIVGRATLVNSLWPYESPWWAEGQQAFVLRDSAPLPFTPYKGVLGFFEIPRSAVNHG